MTSPPRVAIPEPTSTDEAYNQRSLPQYVRAIEAAGGIAVPVPLRETSTSQAEILASCAAILLPGSGADIDPTRYGQEVAKECAAKDVKREATDELLLRDAFRQGKPIFGICYGLQSLNVWRHGSLIQDLAAARAPSTPLVNHKPGREVQKAHPIKVNAGSRLAAALAEHLHENETQLEFFVNSSHHQAVDQPGKDLRVAATSPLDGVIEALEGAEPKQFVIAVQWHPERTYEVSPASRALFASFVEAAREWREGAPKRSSLGAR